MGRVMPDRTDHAPIGRVSVVLLALVAITACSNGTDPAALPPPPIVDLDAEESLTLEAIFADEDYEAERPGRIKWLADGSGYTMLETVEGYDEDDPELDDEGEELPAPKDIVFHDPATGEQRVLVSAAALTPEGAERPLEIDDYRWSEDRSKLLVYTNSQQVWRVKSRGDYWVLDLESELLAQLGGGAEPATLQFAKFSPDGTRVAYVREANIYVEDLSDRSITRLSDRGSDDVINGIMSWAYEEEFSIRDGFRWSPDGTKIAYWQFDTSGVRNFILINNTDELYPTITDIPYPKVGETVSAARIGIVPAGGGATVWADLPGDPRQTYLPRMGWADGSEALIVQQLNRKQDTNRVFYADAGTGDVSIVFVEEELHYIEAVRDVTWFEESDGFLWQSERDGWRHLYRVTLDGQRFTDLTPGEFDVIELEHIDEAGGWLYFLASPEAMEKRDLYRTRLDGSGGMEKITPDRFAGSNGYQISEDGRWAVHSHQTFMQPPQYRLVSLPDHEEAAVLESNQTLIDRLSALRLGDYEFFRVEARDGLPLDGYLMRPPGFDANREYPIIFYVYSEVAGQTVRDAWGGKRHLWHLYMTQRGYLVASVDSRGSRAPRGRAWRKSVYGAIGVLASRDQSDALSAMVERWPWIDDANVGIWGHSGGGSMTLNMLFRYPEQYHAGVSQAPVADQRLYDAIYQERYSGLLDEYAEGYAEASPISHAANLEGELLLVHGTGDDNVHYQGSERLINELVKHNKQFRFMAYPNRTHAISDRRGEGTELHLNTMRAEFFDEFLKAGQ